jgi:hypothetical protein
MSHYTSLVLSLEPNPAWYPKTAEEVSACIDRNYDYVDELENKEERIEGFLKYAEEFFAKRINSRCIEFNIKAYQKHMEQFGCNFAIPAERIHAFLHSFTGYGDYPVVSAIGSSYLSYRAFLFDTFITSKADKVKIYILNAYDVHA